MSQIITQLCGGLGNQMFQYAAGKALSLRYNVPLYLDIEWYNKKQNSIAVRNYQLGIFKNITATIQKYHKYQRIINYINKYLPFSHTIQEPHFAYWPNFNKISPPVRLNGYWQCEKYFMDFQKEIRYDFTFPPLPKKARQISKQILNTSNSVSIHIRRGDYISNPQTQRFHGNLQQDYYSKALQIIKEQYGNTTLFIFSDDPQWVKQKFDYCNHDGIIIDLNFSNSPHHDMHLMSLCKHHIIANSSFSWWGAWLGEKDGITIAPNKWFANSTIKTSDIIPDKWICI